MSENDNLDNNLENRFGFPDYYENIFCGFSDIIQEFEALDGEKGKMTDNYEIARQRFLKLLNKKRMIWEPSNEELDLNVDISRIYHKDRHEYLAFMRIQPRGFRGERMVPIGVEMVFHVLLGKVIFNNKKRIRQMSKGSYVNIKAKTTYSIRCPDEDQPAYLIFRVVNKAKQKECSL